MTMLEVKNLSVRYGTREAVKNVSFSVAEGEWLMLAGPNGAGKSTVVRAVSRAVDCRGEILFRGRDIRALRQDELARSIGVLAQDHAALYAFTVGEVVRLGRYARRPGLFSKRKDPAGEERVNAALSAAGLTELEGAPVTALSGGELQRVFLAQVFAQDPELLLLDEPANHLDLLYQKQIFTLISDWLKAPGRAVVCVVHDLSLALAYGTSALLLDRGGVAGRGGTRETLSPENLERVYGMDVHAWMRGLLGQWD